MNSSQTYGSEHGGDAYENTLLIAVLIETVSLVQATAPDTNRVVVALHSAVDDPTKSETREGAYIFISSSETRVSKASMGMKLLPLMKTGSSLTMK